MKEKTCKKCGKAAVQKIFIFLVLLISIQAVYAQSINVTNPSGSVNITAGSNFNINWTSSGVDHFQITYTTNASADCNIFDGATCSTGDWICLQDHPYGNSGTTSLTTSAPFVNSTTIKIRVEGHSSGHSTLTNSCSDVFTIASIPSVPTNLISSVVNATTINLIWDAQLANELVSYYLIFRDGANIANTTDNNTLSYLDGDLNSSLYYNYTIKKNNPIGDSVFSNSVNASTSSFDVTPPGSINNLTAVEIGENHIFWNWTNPLDSDFNHTQIYRNGVFIEDVFSPNNSYNMTGLSTNTPYSISIRTVDNSSNVNLTFVNLTATTSGSPGGSPGPGGGGGESVSVSSPNGGEIWLPSSSHDITWSSSSVDHFEIWYSTNSGASWILLQAHPYGSSSTTSYSWTLPSSESSTMRIRVDGHDSSHVVQATDRSNSDFSISSTSSSTGGGGGGGGGSSYVGSSGTTGGSLINWAKTYEEDDKDLSEKVSVTKTLGEKERIKIKVDEETHFVGVIELTETSALIEVSSISQQVTLNIGEEKKFEVNNDDYYDILVRLNNITNGKAEVVAFYIHEIVSELSQLFDIAFGLESSSIQDTTELITIVTFESFGNVPTPVNLTFIILDESGNEVYREKSEITVTTEEVLRWNYESLGDLPAGKYTAVLETLYNVDVFDEFRQEFEIGKERKGITGRTVDFVMGEGKWWLSGVSVGIVVIGLVWWLVKKQKGRKEKEQRKKVINT